MSSDEKCPYWITAFLEAVYPGHAELALASFDEEQSIRDATEVIGTLTAERELLLQEAKIHAQEARTQRSTVHEIYQLITGATGEPGDWHGAEPVRALLAERDRLAGQVKTLRDTVYDALLTAKADWESAARHPASRHATDVRFYEAALSAPEPEKETRRHLLPSWAHDGDWHCELCNKVFASLDACLSDSSNCPGPTPEPEKGKT